MHLVRRPIYWALVLAMTTAVASDASADSLIEWLRNRRGNVVNVYVPPGASVPLTTATTAARPIIVYPSTVAAPAVVAPAAAVPSVAAPTTTSYLPTVTPQATVATPQSATAAAAPAITAPSTVGAMAPPVVAQGYTVQYRARTRYRTTWVQVPLTVYRPTTTVDPVTQATTTALRPCQTYTWQVRRVPVVEWKPIRVLPGPPPAGSIPTVTVPTVPAVPSVPAGSVAPPSTGTSGWPAVTAPPTGTTIPSRSTAPPSIPPVPSSSSPSVRSNGSSADEAPRLSPDEAQRLQKPPQPAESRDSSSRREDNPPQLDKTESDRRNHGRRDGSSNGGPDLTAPIPPSANSGTSTGASSRQAPSSQLRPIPREDHRQPTTRQPRSPRELEDPPQLLDPRDPIARRTDAQRIVPTAFRATSAIPTPSQQTPPGVRRKASKAVYSTEGWYSVKQDH